MSRVKDFLSEFVVDLETQLEDDERRWGDTWKKRDIEGQAIRLKVWVKDMFDRLENGDLTDEDKQKEYLKLVGGVLINWIRLEYPELYKK